MGVGKLEIFGKKGHGFLFDFHYYVVLWYIYLPSCVSSSPLKRKLLRFYENGRQFNAKSWQKIKRLSKEIHRIYVSHWSSFCVLLYNGGNCIENMCVCIKGNKCGNELHLMTLIVWFFLDLKCRANYFGNSCCTPT